MKTVTRVSDYWVVWWESLYIIIVGVSTIDRFIGKMLKLVGSFIEHKVFKFHVALHEILGFSL